MSIATEIAAGNLIDNIDLRDPASDHQKILLNSLTQIRAWKGCSGVRWAVEDKAKLLRLYVDWESTELHAEANRQPEYLPVVIPLGTLTSGHVYCHAHFEPYRPEALTKAGVTIEITLFFDKSFTRAEQDAFHEKMKATDEIYRKHGEGYVASTSGWVVEPQTIPGTTDTGKAYVALVGWKSAEKASAFPGTQTFKDNFQPLYFQDAVKGTKVVHLEFQDVGL